MAEKIFISYNHKDNLLIDTIARRLELEFGRNNITYDRWTMQPGDSIIGKMNEGLAEFTTFFFFVSPNSLASKMVTLEWQTALNRTVNNDLKFVAVKISDCLVPTILLDKIYIDLYGEGLDDAVEKMKCVVNAKNNYKPLANIENLLVNISVLDETKAKITIRALYYSEDNPKFAFACKNSLESFFINSFITDGIVLTGTQTIQLSTGEELNAHTVQLQRILRPGFPFSVELGSDNLHDLECIAVLILVNAEERRYQNLTITIDS